MNLHSNLLGFSYLTKNIKFLKNYNVILKDPVQGSKQVRLISGGGSGHFPFPNGFVGEGMLDAAVCGEIYASPSVNSVIASILSFDKADEILVIINNYTGDRLNFGLAIESIRNFYGYQKVDLLIVNDDCSINDENVKKSVGKRGLAGSCLIYKIAGAMANQGSSGIKITEYCNNVLSNKLLRTIGFSFEENDNKLINVEIGKGVHGEPGVSNIKESEDFTGIIDILLEKLNIELNKKVVIMINDLGATTDYCLMNFVHQFLRKIESFNLIIERFYVGPFLTSLHTQGISVTVLDIEDPQILNYLDLPTDCPMSHLFNRNFKLNVPNVSNFLVPEDVGILDNSGVILNDIQSEFLKTSTIFACEALVLNKLMLNQIDSILADGDTGSTLSRGAEKILKNVNDEKIEFKNLKSFFQQLSILMRDHCGGSIGVLYSIFFQCASNCFERSSDFNSWLEALKKGTEGMMLYGQAEIGDRTMIDSLKEGEKYLENYLNGNLKPNLLEAVEKFDLGCDLGCKRTIEMTPKSGRSVYTEKKSDQPDPGAAAISIITRAVFEAIKSVSTKYKK